MIKKLLLSSLLIPAGFYVRGQAIAPSAWQKFPDSTVVAVHASYDQVSRIHRWLFGENYRKDWAMKVKLPVIKLSQVNGGLSPLKQGGGMESKSLRLEDKTGREWVLRSVEKVPDKLLPPNLQGTFAVDWVGDEFSGQHPYSALVVPPLAEAANVPHANPVIGVVADDPVLGQYSKTFVGLVCLLEEREPVGHSDNTFKMQDALLKSNDNRVDGREFLRARLLDLLMTDWDRHEDQWRWADTKNGKGKLYTAVPRDRDQVFHVTQGVFPSIASWSWIDPTLEDFDPAIPRVKYSLFKTRFMKEYPDAQLPYDEYMKIVNEFVKAETDVVLEASLQRLPREIYQFRHDELLAKLKQRRDNIPRAMTEYYKFINRIVDIRTTDKSELITVTDGPDKATRITVARINKEGETKDQLMDMLYQPDITKEIRLFTSAGDDKVQINTANSPIKLRLIDSVGDKTVDVKQASRRVQFYGRKNNITFTGDTDRLNRHLSNDSLNTQFLPTNLYNVWMPLATAALNKDDGFLLGAGFKYTGYDGFRKLPYSTVQQLMITHSFATDAFRIRYSGEWIDVFGKADFTMQANIQSPDNTVNFFGLGNESTLNKFKGYRTFYRTRYDIYQFDPALRWHTGKNSDISAGPSFQFYHLDLNDNAGRFISQTSLINSYDSLTVGKDKAHLGALINYTTNQRDNNILPKKGFYFTVTAQAYTGLNDDSKSFVQIKPEFTWYQSLTPGGAVVLSDRVGGGVSFGKPAFYQSLFLGGQGNLLGYLQNRFAGKHMVFNNLQARVKLADIASYILPGQLGLVGFYDAGRVWVDNEHSDKWHTGTGGGLYFAPASLTVLQLLAGHSTEGWYPYISLNFRL